MAVRVWVYVLNMAKFECPHCSQRIDAPDELVGADADCPACGKAITVPQAGVNIELPPPPKYEQSAIKPQGKEALGVTKEPEPSGGKPKGKPKGLIPSWVKGKNHAAKKRQNTEVKELAHVTGETKKNKKSKPYILDKPSELAASILLCIFFLWWNWNGNSTSDVMFRIILYIALLKSTVGIFRYYEERS